MGDVRKARNRVKATTSKLLALFMAAVLMCSTLGSVAAVADTQDTASGSNDATDCSISGYTSTDNLVANENNKSDDTQENVQTASTTNTTYTTSLLQSAEWTNKATGKAAINIHYEADFSADANRTEIRSLYVFTTCTAHGFSISIAVQNIVDLLDFNDYVDVIMIGVTNQAGNDGEIAAAMMFSVSADDNKTSVEATVRSILSNPTSSNLASQTNVYGLGQTKGSGTTGSIELLYNDGTYSTTDTTAAAYALAFGIDRHVGMYFSPYYIQKYLNILDNRNVDLNSTVQYIINSFDGFSGAHRNATFSEYSTSLLYQYVGSLVGKDLSSFTSLTGSLSTGPCANAVATICDYDTKGRYVVLNPVDTHSNATWTISSSDWSSTTEQSTIEEILYTMFLIDPTGTWSSPDALRSEISGYLQDTTGHTYTTGELGSYQYNVGVSDLGLFNIDWAKTFVITATITSEFEIDGGTSDITVSNLSGTGTSFSYEISTSGGNGSDTVVTISITELTDNVNEWTIDVSIPVKLVAGTMSFRGDGSDEDAFKETNAADTTVSVVSLYVIDAGNQYGTVGSDYEYETVSVASPKLYRAAGSLTVTKTVDGSNPDTSQAFDFAVTLPSTVSGTFYYYTGTYDEDSTTYSTITFTGGKITAVDGVTSTTIISLKHEESFTIVGLLTDVAYTVTEREASGYYAKSITVTDSDSQSVSGSSVDTAARTATTSISADETVTVAYTNTNTFDFVIWKYTGTDTSLGGATFSVAALNANGEAGTSTPLTATDSTSGKTTASSLSVGTVYKVEETQAAAGYNILSDSFYIMVGSDGKLYLGDSSDSLASTSTTTAVDGAVSIGSSTGTFQVNVLNTLNTTSALLPTTGGSGTLLFSVAGVALVALAAYALYRQRRGMRTCAAHAATPYQAPAGGSYASYVPLSQVLKSKPYAAHASTQQAHASRPQPTRRRIP